MTETIEFNYTGRLAEKSAQIYREAKDANRLWGRCISRLENLATPLTALIDAISYLAVGILIALGAGMLVGKMLKVEGSPLTFKVGLNCIFRGLKLVPSIIIAPVLGFVSPPALSAWFNKPIIKPKEKPTEDSGKIIEQVREHDSIQAKEIITKADTVPLLPEKPTEDSGKIIEQVWVHDSFQAKEIITRVDTVPLLQKAAEKELAYLQKYKEDSYKGITVGERRAQLLRRINQCKQMEGNRNWATSNYFRDFLRGEAKLSTTFPLEDRLKAYEEIMEGYMPLAINMRSHSCSILNGKTNSLVRVGVISDMSNGYTNYMELKEIKSELEGTGESKKLEELHQFLLKINGESSMQSSMLGNLIIGNLINGISSLLMGKNDQTSLTAKYAYNQVKDLETIKKTLARRKMHLEDQFLQLVMEHLKDGPSGDMTTLPMVHIGLLNQDKKDFDDTGWYHNEANEMADMAQIFNDFNGKLLICDGSGPFVDEQGNIHLPFEIKNAGESKTISIQSFFVNSSVQGHKQGHTGKDMTAKKINRDTFEKLKSAEKISDPKKKKKTKRLSIKKKKDETIESNEEEKIINKILNKGKNTSYTTAYKLIQWFRKAGFYISFGCLSAKDRTGFVGACDAVLNQMGDNIPEDIQRKFIIEQLAPDKPGVKVVKDNNPETNVMKVEPFFIPLVTDSVTGVVKRIGQWKFQVDEIFKERKRIKEKQKI